MKYSELISFNPIEDVIQLVTAGNKEKARAYVKDYIVSDNMVANLQAPVIDQLQMDEPGNNKGILVVGNYGTGKSHLMSVVSAIANDAENLSHLRNKKFAESLKPIAGRFEVLRLEIGGTGMPLYEFIMSSVQDDFKLRGIEFSFPPFNQVRNVKLIVKEMMAAFATKYPGKGYLIVVDEFLAYLQSHQSTQEIVRDMEIFRAMGEMCSQSPLRIMFGMQEKLFDNPKFSFVADSLRHVSDRFAQVIITKEATSYVVSERILKKTPEQKARIREHLEQFCCLYGGMANRLEEFVDLFPIHPSYFDVFNRLYLIENRHILKNISKTIRSIFDTDVPEAAPGIISFDNYWPAIKGNGLLKTDPTISRVVGVSGQLEDIISRAFPKPAYKAMAMQIVYALSVHRLTTHGLDVQFGMTTENLKDDLCLYLQLPEKDSEFLLSVVKTVMKDVMSTVSGQFIFFNENNQQYYIDVDKAVDYDEKIKQKSELISDEDLNASFYSIVYNCLEWDAKQYVTNFNIYEYDLNWDSHNMFREGYLFMGLPNQRSTAQPERDFYIHIMPPYGNMTGAIKDLNDEVYLHFRSTEEFKNDLKLYSSAVSLAAISDGKDKEAYTNKAGTIRKKLIRFLSENKNTCFDITYKQHKRAIIEVLKGRYNSELSFREVIDLVSSISFDAYFNEKYPEYPMMKTRITRRNMADSVRSAIDYFAGRKTQQAVSMLASFGVLDGDRISSKNSPYATYFANLLKELPRQGVLNYSDLFEFRTGDRYMDKKFQIEYTFTPIVFLALVYDGAAILTLRNNKMISAGNIEDVEKINAAELNEFKFISRPLKASLAELKHLFEILGLNPALLNTTNREKGVNDLLAKAKELCNNAVVSAQKLNPDFTLWGESLVPAAQIPLLQESCKRVSNEFSNYSARFNTPAKLNNFALSMEEIDRIGDALRDIGTIERLLSFKNLCGTIVNYIAGVETVNLGDDFKSDLNRAKDAFRSARDSIRNGVSAEAAAQKVTDSLAPMKARYVAYYLEEHKKMRLGINDSKRRGKIQEGNALRNLKKLRGIDEILSAQKLTEIENEMASLKTCYELSEEEMNASPVCPHCHFRIDDHDKPVHGKLDLIESRLDSLLEEWTKKLLDTLADPIVLDQKQFLNAEQRKVVDALVSSGGLPPQIDDFFVTTIRQLLRGFESVAINAGELVDKLCSLPPLDEENFTRMLLEWVSSRTSGKDAGKLRIVVKK